MNRQRSDYNSYHSWSEMAAAPSAMEVWETVSMDVGSSVR